MLLAHFHEGKRKETKRSLRHGTIIELSAESSYWMKLESISGNNVSYSRGKRSSNVGIRVVKCEVVGERSISRLLVDQTDRSFGAELQRTLWRKGQ